MAKEKRRKAPELASWGPAGAAAASKFLISPALSAKNLLPDLLPDNFLGKIV